MKTITKIIESRVSSDHPYIVYVDGAADRVLLRRADGTAGSLSLPASDFALYQRLFGSNCVYVI